MLTVGDFRLFAAPRLLHLHIAEVKAGGDDFENEISLVIGHAENIHCFLEREKNNPASRSDWRDKAEVYTIVSLYCSLSFKLSIFAVPPARK